MLVVLLAVVVCPLELPAVAMLVVLGLSEDVNGAALTTAVVAPALPPARCCNVMNVIVSLANAHQSRSTSFVARLEGGVVEGEDVRQVSKIHYRVVLPGGGSRPSIVVVVEAGGAWEHVGARGVAYLVVEAVVKRRNVH